VVISAGRRRQDPDRSAWFLTEERAWRGLERYVKIAPAEAADRLAAETGVRVYPERGASAPAAIERRKAYFSPALSLTYRQPVKFVRGRRQYLIDEGGRPYLDLYNNVCHVGHSHPRVVEAAHRQMALLNTNTRYLFDQLVEYAERLTATLPPALRYCFFVNSGSEANELALRLARTHTGRRDLVVLENAYHGHTGRLIEISPYKFMGPGGSGASPPWVHVAPMPDGYRGPHKGGGRDAGAAYGEEVGRIIRAIDRPICGMIAESLPSCGGQIIPPEGYFEAAFSHVRQAGGVCILDEVQVGFGRVGTHRWGFEIQGVVPDIVVMGKPIGNGHPLGAVVTTAEIAESFAAAGMEFFSTFGGNPVSCAVGLAVLDVIEEEGLQQRALEVGTYLRDGLRDLMDHHPILGDVRGAGLFIGIELVEDRATLEPATEGAADVINALRRRRILTGTDGPYENVIKIKPPMVVIRDDADLMIRTLDEVLRDLPALG
jgi:4-aminobutyrate aminotransferase-like enzyme